MNRPGSLDYENKKIVIDTLIRLNDEGKTIVVGSHDKDFEKVAHRIILLKKSATREVLR